MTKQDFVPLPNALWVATDVDVDIPAPEPDSVPTNVDQLIDFSEYLNPHLTARGATWAKYVLFDNQAKPVAAFEYEF